MIFFFFPKRNTNAVVLTCPVMPIMKSETNDEASSLKMHLTAVTYRTDANKTSALSGRNRRIKRALNKSKIIAGSVYKRALSVLLDRVKLQYLFS